LRAVVAMRRRLACSWPHVLPAGGAMPHAASATDALSAFYDPWHGDTSFLFGGLRRIVSRVRRRRRLAKLRDQHQVLTAVRSVESTAHRQRRLPKTAGLEKAALAARLLHDEGAESSSVFAALAVPGLGAGRAPADFGDCDSASLKLSYERFFQALSEAQARSFGYGQTSRWLDLQRADDLTRFLQRVDVSELTLGEVEALGKAWQATEMAGHQLAAGAGASARRREVCVPNDLAASLFDAQRHARSVAAHGFRCRASSFLWT